MKHVIISNTQSFNVYIQCSENPHFRNKQLHLAVKSIYPEFISVQYVVLSYEIETIYVTVLMQMFEMMKRHERFVFLYAL